MLSGKCKLYNVLAYAMTIYCITSVYYMVRSSSVGTPFNDSLSPEQQVIKQQSVAVRKQIFMEGLFITTMYLILARPFESCSS